MTHPAFQARRRVRNIAWAVVLGALVLMGLAIAWSHERTRPIRPAAVTPAPTSRVSDFESYQRVHAARVEARLARDRAAYEAYEKAHRADQAPPLRKLPETPAR